MVKKKPAKPVERNTAALQEKIQGSRHTPKTSRGGKKSQRRNPMSSNLATSTTSTSNLDSWRAALSQATTPGLLGLGLQPRFAMPSTSTTTVASQNFAYAEGGSSSMPFPNLPSRLDSQASSLPLDLPSSADFSINPAAWPYRWTNMKDIMDDDIMSYLRKHWTTQMVVSAVIPNRKTTLDSSLFMDTLKTHPWQDSADLIFHCNGNRPVKIHSVLLGAVLPGLVEDLSKYRNMHLNNGPTSANVIIKTPLFLRGIEPDAMEGFLGLCGKGIGSMTGKNVSGVKVIMEALNIEEMSVYVHLGNFTSLSQSQSATEASDPVDTSATERMTDARSPLNLRRIAAVPSGISSERSRQTEDSQTTEELGERNEQSETGRKKLSVQEALDEISQSVSSEAGVASGSPLAVRSSSTTSTSGRAKRRSGRFSNPTQATPNRRSNRLKNLNTVSQVDVDECTEWVAKQSGQNPEVLEGTGAAEVEEDQSLENFRTVKTVYPEEVRLNVLDALQRGQSVSDLSNYYSASLPLINRWKYAADLSKKKDESSVEAPSAESTSANEWNISVQAGNSGGRNNAHHQLQGASVQGQGAASSSSALPLQTPSTAPDTSIYFGTNANAQAAHSAIAILRNSLNGNRDTQLTQPSFTGTENSKPGNENDGVRDLSTNRSMPSDSSTGNYDTRMNPHGFQ